MVDRILLKDYQEVRVRSGPLQGLPVEIGLSTGNAPDYHLTSQKPPGQLVLPPLPRPLPHLSTQSPDRKRVCWEVPWGRTKTQGPDNDGHTSCRGGMAFGSHDRTFPVWTGMSSRHVWEHAGPQGVCKRRVSGTSCRDMWTREF